jgi:hypothetical protein
MMLMKGNKKNHKTRAGQIKAFRSRQHVEHKKRLKNAFGLEQRPALRFENFKGFPSRWLKGERTEIKKIHAKAFHSVCLGNL